MVTKTQRLDTVIDIWRERLKKAFELADVGEQPGTPHRFRHTFARILLQKGVSVAAVADLMGDTEQVVRASYNRWVPARQAALTKILKDAFSEKPKLAALHGERT
jgi:integrase